MSWWSTLGKIGAGIAAPFTGGLSLAAIPALGAIEGAQHGGGWTGALKGGAIGGAEALVPFGLSKIPGISNLGGGIIGKMVGTGAKQEGQALANKGIGAVANSLGGSDSSYDPELGGSPVSPSGSPVAGSDSGYDPELGGSPTTPNVDYGPTMAQAGFGDVGPIPPTGTQGGTGFIQKLLQGVKSEFGNGKLGQNLSDAGSVFGGMENGEAANRYKKADMTQAYDRLALEAAQNRRLDETDAMKKLHQSGYILGGGSKYGQPVQLNSGTIPIFPNGPMAPTDAMRQGASTLQDQMLARLQPGGSWAPTKPDYLDRGKLETAGQIGGVAGGIGGVIANILGGGKPATASYPPGYPNWGTPPIVPSNGSTT